jgi:hypothetical protein
MRFYELVGLWSGPDAAHLHEGAASMAPTHDEPKRLELSEFAAASSYFETMKCYARHEDSLLNNRVNWCLLVNSFLFTALAVLTSQATAMAKDYPGAFPLMEGRSVYAVVVFSIALTGALLTFSSSLGVVAATLSLGRLERCWRKNRRRFDNYQLFPNMLGAGSRWADVLGNIYPLLLIFTLLAVWSIVLVVVVTTDLRL